MRIDDLGFAYGNKTVFDHFSLDLEEKTVCIMAESGKGKTTLLKLIASLLEPQYGTIVRDFERPSFMFQEDRLLKWLNVKENIALVSDNEQLIKEYLDYFELDPLLKVDELSGGMARRTALIRTLVYDSDCLLLDEPFTGMDEKLTGKAGELILAQKKRVIFSSHDQKEAEILGAKIIHI